MRTATSLCAFALSITTASMMPSRYARAAGEEPEAADDAGDEAEASAEEGGGGATATEEPRGRSELVELRNGGRLRGDIVELLPGETLTIVSEATGSTKTIGWAEVARYTEEGAWIDVGEEPAVAGTSEAQERGGAPEADGPRVHIDVKGAKPMALYQITSESVATGSVGGSSVVVHGMTYDKVCAAPCDKRVDLELGDRFFVAGKRISGSKAFSVAPDQGDLTVSVKPGRRGVLFGGWLAASFGFSALLAGAVWYPIAKLDLAESGDPNLKPAIGMLVGGGVALVGGVTMIVLGRTKLKFRGGGLGLLRPLRFG